MNKSRFAYAMLPLLLLAGCGDGAGNGTQAAPVANVAAPAGQNWVDTIALTPEGGYRMGNPAAPIKLVEFGSRTCHVCAAFEEEGVPTLKQRYVASGKVSFEFRDYLRNPIDIAGALIGQCNGVEPFFPLVEQMMKGQEEILNRAQEIAPAVAQRIGTLPPAQQYAAYADAVGLVDWAKQRGMPEPKVRQCLGDTAKADALVAANARATEDFAISGTPTFLINGTKAEAVSWSQLEPLIRARGG